MQRILLLMMIYIAFISLGLPDTALGVAWPTMRHSLSLPLEAAGIFVMVTTLCTTISSFMSGHFLGKLGTGKVVFISCVMTGLALLGYSISPSFGWLLLLTIPLGLGAGAVDTGLNNYVAVHYSSRQMSWLHCFWGVGAFFGPNIMNFMIVRTTHWEVGYRVIGLTQLAIALLLFISLPLWKQNENKHASSTEEHEKAAPVSRLILTEKLKGLVLLRKKGVLLSILVFPLYVGVEGGTGLWLGSYLIDGMGLPQIRAGIIVSLFYLSITVGRFLNGLIAERFTNKQLIRMGLVILVVGVFLLNIPFKFLLIPSVLLLGLGCAPIFPSMVHETPQLFGKINSQAITGFQIGSAYLSGVVITPIIGLLASHLSIQMIPIMIGLFSVIMILSTERLNSVSQKA